MALLLGLGGFSSIGAGIAAGVVIVFAVATAAEFATTLVPVIIRGVMMTMSESAAKSGS